MTFLTSMYIPIYWKLPFPELHVEELSPVNTNHMRAASTFTVRFKFQTSTQFTETVNHMNSQSSIDMLTARVFLEISYLIFLALNRI